MDRLRLKTIKKKPTMAELAQPNMNKNAELIFRVSFDDARKEQEKILRQAKSL